MCRSLNARKAVVAVVAGAVILTLSRTFPVALANSDDGELAKGLSVASTVFSSQNPSKAYASLKP